MDGGMTILNTLKMETCFVRRFGDEVGLTDDADFAAFALKHNFRNKKTEKQNMKGWNNAAKSFINYMQIND